MCTFTHKYSSLCACVCLLCRHAYPRSTESGTQSEASNNHQAATNNMQPTMSRGQQATLSKRDKRHATHMHIATMTTTKKKSGKSKKSSKQTAMIDHASSKHAIPDVSQKIDNVAASCRTHCCQCCSITPCASRDTATHTKRRDERTCSGTDTVS